MRRHRSRANVSDAAAVLRVDCRGAALNRGSMKLQVVRREGEDRSEERERRTEAGAGTGADRNRDANRDGDKD